MRRRLMAGGLVGILGACTLSVVLTAQQGPTAVVEAAMQGRRDTVRTLLKDGADVNAAQGDGMTALHWAAMKNDVELAQMLVYAGANVRATTRLGGYTPLLLAAKHGGAPLVSVLLKAGADPKAATSTGTTPLMLAATSGDAEAVTALLDAGAEVDAKESAMGQTSLMFATAFNRLEAMKVLLARGADLKLTTKVVNLTSLTSPEEEFFAQQFQQNQNRQAQGGQPGQAPAAAPGAAAPSGGAARPPAAAAPAAGTPAAGGGRPAGAPAAGAPAPAAQPAQGGGRFGFMNGKAGLERPYRYNELVGTQGGLSPLHFAARQGYLEATQLLIASGADINMRNPGDRSTPLLVSLVNGHFDLGLWLLGKGADATLASANGVTPLYAVINVQWAPKALYPQPRAYLNQKATYLETMQALLDRGADPNARVSRKVWYSGYNFDLSGVDEIGGTAFWRAAYGADVDAMKLLVRYGADPSIPTMKPAGRPRTGDGTRDAQDVSGLPPVAVGGPGITPLQAAAGAGYGEGFAANAHRFAPAGMLAAAKYLVEDLGVDVNAQDHEGNTALHHAASRGDNDMIRYLVEHGADVTKVNREGKTTADMANGPVQRVQPFPETLKLLEKLGAKNNHKCVSC